MTSPIRTKAEFYARWHAGLLGNRPRTWADAAALAASGYTRPVVVRSAVMPAWKVRYGVSVEEALALAKQTPGLTFNELLEDENILLQGEVMRTPRGLALFYSTASGLRMREALAQASQHAYGLAAKLLLDHYLAPTSRDDLDDLLDLYDDHVVEFGVYDRNIGDQPHRNTLFWETRRY